MPTDIVGGTTGAVTATGFNVDVDGWQATTGAEDTVGYRTFSSVWKSKKNVGYGGSGSFTGTVQFDDTGTAPMPSLTGGEIDAASFEGVSLTLTATTGCTYTGTANITTVAVNRSSGDRMTGTFNFEFDGPISIAWDETA
ncbi:MAG: hypothetical protein AAFY08_15090 [Planctomycetota bacterium]